MAKATHYGICQVCGSRQKLPNGKLSKHGYDVEHGFFNGVCYGADHLPFEQSKDLIDHDIKRCHEKIQELTAMCVVVRGDETHIYLNEWRPAGRHGRGYHIWCSHKVEDVEINWHIQYTNGLGKKERGDYYFNEKEHRELYAAPEGEARDALRKKMVIKHMNNKRAEAFEETIRKIKNHITWQEIRIKDWEPKELDPIQGVSQ